MLNAVAPQPEPSVKKREGPKGPNPLSMKKKAPKNRIQEVSKTNDVAAAQVKVDRRKRKQQEEDNGSGNVNVSVVTEPRPKRRRRHKATARPVDGV
jgi:U3 small nucleolar RNA-associated protein 23